MHTTFHSVPRALEIIDRKCCILSGPPCIGASSRILEKWGIESQRGCYRSWRTVVVVGGGGGGFRWGVVAPNPKQKRFKWFSFILVC